jgi:hypothetical protein
MNLYKRLGLLLLIVLLPVVVLAQSEPMANTDCTSANLEDQTGLIDDFYGNARTALESGDIRGYLDNLRGVSWLTGSLRALCDNYSFSGDAEGSNSLVTDPITIMPGIYTVTATTAGYLSVRLEPISGGCGRVPFTMVITEGNATEGAQEVFRVEDEACVALLQVSNITEVWSVEFSLVSSQ